MARSGPLLKLGPKLLFVPLGTHLTKPFGKSDSANSNSVTFSHAIETRNKW